MDQALEKVAFALADSASPVVLCSFGKDSVLLLDMVREMRPNTPVIWYRTGQPEHFARRMIREWNLTAFSWAPADVYLLTDGHQRTLVHEYGIGEDRLPVLIDLDGSNGPCTSRRFADRTPTLYLPFDTLLVGWKDTDTHWVKGDGLLAADGFKLGSSQVFAPLRHMSDEQVRSAIHDRKIPFEPTPDELTLCTHCVQTMPLPEFRSRFNLTTEEVSTNGTGVC